MTGESEPVHCVTGCTSDIPQQSCNRAWAGSLVVDGAGIGIVVDIGDDTMIGKIARLTSGTTEKRTILESEILRFVKMSGGLSFLLAVFMVGLGLGRKFGTITVVIAAISIVIANVPQGLPSAVMTVLTLTAKALQKRNVFVKKLHVVETLGCCTVIASDKTGTLTQNKMTAIHSWASRAAEEASLPEEVVKTSPSAALLDRVLVLCNRITVDAHVTSVDKMTFSADASEIGLFKLAFECPLFHSIRARYPKVAEVPFNSKHKWQLSIHRLPANEGQPEWAKYLMVIKGAPEYLLGFSRAHYASDGSVRPTSAAHTAMVKSQLIAYASLGERVLGFSDAFITEDEKQAIEQSHELPDSTLPNIRFAGLATLLDPPKEGVAEAVLQCHSAGIKVIMITGDFPVTAAAIAKQVNILDDRVPSEDQGVFTGQDIAAFTPSQWDTVLSKPRLVFARMQPDQKLTVVEQLQRRKEVVAVTGDGVNDSPALKRADVGIAMGIAGTEVAKEAAKIICADDNFASIVEGIRYGRIIFDNLRKTIMLVVTHLVPETWPFLFQFIFSMPLGLSPLLLLTIDLGTEMLPSICLAYEGPEADVMLMPPRDLSKNRLVNFFSISHTYLEFGMIESLFCTAMYLHLLMVHYAIPAAVMGNSLNYFYLGADNLVLGNGISLTDTEQVHILHEVQTLWYITIVSCQIGHVLAIRGVRVPSWRLEHNPRLYIACILSFLIGLFFMFTPGVTHVFLSRAFPPRYWIGVFLAGFLIWLIAEFKKMIIRSHISKKQTSKQGRQMPSLVAAKTTFIV